ncbi:Swt1 family HEPN domain-containing protein [Bradyrhizobium sp. NC92]|uniref:Swt1 family HEPN domain-containing protein n=1 Tax=Bradyrhizobium sp. (strain NC92) TaxID=55395 RepID=UPI0021AAEBBE|nr:Swt1 family HEPN domain-containing protein [Bradyrhizobium sp. NC92]UWU68206.1 Swt1 family HEPN domain-containing protein [Bradyrhizobium sp. NC92]
MKPSDLIQKQIEDSQRLAKHLEAFNRTDLQRLTGGYAANDYLESIRKLAGQASRAHASFAESARIASGALASLKASMPGVGGDFSEAIRRMSELPAGLKLLQESAYHFEQQFRLTNQHDLARLSQLAESITVPKWPNDIQRQLESIRAPFIQMQDSLKSLRGFSELSAIGAAVRIVEPFEAGLVGNLRRDLGDWRDTEVDATDLLDDPEGRVAVYEERGFNAELADFPAEAFENALTVTGIDLGAVSPMLAPPPADMVPAFNVHGYQWLFVLERELRVFILKCLTEASGGNWEARLPPKMRDKWQEKRAKALSEGEAEQPLINYADFTDYNDIILGAANWRDCFKGTFKREEAVREGFNRLRPIRLVTAHMRFMTNEEWLILNLEVRRILKAIGVSI